MKKLFKSCLIALWLSSVLLIAVAGCSHEAQEMDNTKPEAGLADEQSDSVRIVSMKNNTLEYILNAKHIQRYYKSKILHADTVRVESYDENGLLRSVLTSDVAIMDEIKNQLTAEQNVVIVNDANDSLKTEHLVWDRNTDEIYAKDQVTIIRGENIFHGRNLWTDTSFKELRSADVQGSGRIGKEDMNDE